MTVKVQSRAVCFDCKRVFFDQDSKLKHICKPREELTLLEKVMEILKGISEDKRMYPYKERDSK